jgi:hypothetical protein
MNKTKVSIFLISYVWIHTNLLSEDNNEALTKDEILYNKEKFEVVKKLPSSIMSILDTNLYDYPSYTCMTATNISDTVNCLTESNPNRLIRYFL